MIPNKIELLRLKRSRNLYAAASTSSISDIKLWDIAK